MGTGPKCCLLSQATLWTRPQPFIYPLHFFKYTKNNPTANTSPAGYPTTAGRENPSLAIRIYVSETADIKVAGSAVRRELLTDFPSFKRYAVATHREIMARVWLLQEK